MKAQERKISMGKFEDLQGYAELLSSGAITQEEFDTVKTKLLAAPQPAIAPRPPLTRGGKMRVAAGILLLIYAVLSGIFSTSSTKTGLWPYVAVATAGILILCYNDTRKRAGIAIALLLFAPSLYYILSLVSNNYFSYLKFIDYLRFIPFTCLFISIAANIAATILLLRQFRTDARSVASLSAPMLMILLCAAMVIGSVLWMRFLVSYVLVRYGHWLTTLLYLPYAGAYVLLSFALQEKQNNRKRDYNESIG
jgi:hypothetical protein